jgi:hypothetical protein
VVEKIEPEQALWLLGCLAIDEAEVPSAAVLPYLTSKNWRERIDAAVILNLFGFAPQAARVLATEVAKPYGFKEIMGIGKSHYDENFRDKCYLVMALARHVEDVTTLEPFADPRRYYRDIRYGLALGLGYRGTPDGIGLLTRLAGGDPISVIRRHARESLRAIQETQELAGNPVPRIELAESAAFEVHYPPRGLNWPPPAVLPPPKAAALDAESLEDLGRLVSLGLEADNYRDLNNSNNQAPGAKRMMIGRIDEFDRGVGLLCAKYPDSSGGLVESMLASPYPTAHFLALREITQGSAPAGEDKLIAKLDAFAKTADTVGFYWTCEALAQRGTRRAIPVLAKYATDEAWPDLHGPLGMGHGYPAAKALARLAAKISDPEVERLLAGENIWLRGGALAGLTEAHAPGIANLLSRLLDEDQPGLIHDHCRVGLRTLGIVE